MDESRSDTHDGSRIAAHVDNLGWGLSQDIVLFHAAQFTADTRDRLNQSFKKTRCSAELRYELFLSWSHGHRCSSTPFWLSHAHGHSSVIMFVSWYEVNYRLLCRHQLIGFLCYLAEFTQSVPNRLSSSSFRQHADQYTVVEVDQVSKQTHDSLLLEVGCIDPAIT